MSGVNFVSMGHTAEVLAWRITVKDGTATLDGTEAGAYTSTPVEPMEPWRCEYTADELRDLAALFTGAADLLDGEQRPVDKKTEGLSLMELVRLPVGAQVRDSEGDVWNKTGTGSQAWECDDTGIGDSSSDSIFFHYSPLTLVSMGSVQG